MSLENFHFILNAERVSIHIYTYMLLKKKEKGEQNLQQKQSPEAICEW